jgi:hypothetical protein
MRNKLIKTDFTRRFATCEAAYQDVRKMLDGPNQISQDLLEERRPGIRLHVG